MVEDPRLKMPSDEELMSATARGDLAAFEQLVKRHQTSAWNAAFRLLGNTQDAEDAAQEAFLRILGAAPRYQPSATFRTYLYRILTHLCRDHHRRRRALPCADLDVGTHTALSPENQAARREEGEAVRQALAALPARQREAVVLRYYERLSYDQISLVTGGSRKAVERLLARARSNLAHRLGRLFKN
jgi:RNA polymerase sigma-70 factor, ECF subfamily